MPRRDVMRNLLMGAAGVATAGALRRSCRAEVVSQQVVVPLQWREGAFCFRYYVANSLEAARDGSAARALTSYWGVADTGSPFMLVARCLRKDCPSYCASWGCFHGEGQLTGIPDSFEGYASGLNEMQWRRGTSLMFPDASPGGEVIGGDLRFGVQGRIIGAGGTGNGVFFGLVRDRMEDVQPSFLEQTDFTSLGVDLRKPGAEALTLSSGNLVQPSDAVLPLVDPRQWGDPVRHYAAIARSISVGGEELLVEGSGQQARRVLCIFDTGTTGTSMTPNLYEQYLNTVRRHAEQGASLAQARRLEASFVLPDGGKEMSLELLRGRHPAYGSALGLVTPMEEVAWAGIGPPASLANYRVPKQQGATAAAADFQRPFDDVMFLGLGFLIGRKLTIDAVGGRLAITPRTMA